MYRPPQSRHNQLLSMLSHETRDRLGSALDLVALESGKVLQDIGARQRYAYFPTDCIVSLLNVAESGATTEVSMVGNEGMLDIALFMGGESSRNTAVVRASGFAYRMSAQRFKSEFDRHGELMNLMLRYTQTLIAQISQTAMCYRHHSIDQQLCRWLLLSMDRLGECQMKITHEVIANMLGVRRESITEAVGRLQKLGVVGCTRGKLQVLDRDRLEQLCCECYGVITAECARLLPGSDDYFGFPAAESLPRVVGAGVVP